jgi:hypothetical protein
VLIGFVRVSGRLRVARRFIAGAKTETSESKSVKRSTEEVELGYRSAVRQADLVFIRF